MQGPETFAATATAVSVTNDDPDLSFFCHSQMFFLPLSQ